MKLSAQEIVDIYSSMRMHDVVLYGAGGRGGLAIETLKEDGFNIIAVADKEIGKMCSDFCSISLEDLCRRGNNEVCIVTPKAPLDDVWTRLQQNFDMVVDIQIIYWMKYFVPKDKDIIDYSCCFPFNHYESPYVRNSELSIYNKKYHTDEILDINLNINVQLKFLPKLCQCGSEFFKLQQIEGSDFRYKSNNGWFDDADAALLHSMLRENNPKRIIEIGSGYSTCVMLDTNEYWLNGALDITSIEPYPDRLYSNIKEDDKMTLHIVPKFIQDVSLNEFDRLESGDILFIDSSHVAKVGGDIPWEYFNILPRLKNGVIIHIHDILYPFTYSEKWLIEGRAYDEAFILRALLMNSSKYEILFFNNMMYQQFQKEYERQWDSDRQMIGGSIWIRKNE